MVYERDVSKQKREVVTANLGISVLASCIGIPGFFKEEEKKKKIRAEESNTFPPEQDMCNRGAKRRKEKQEKEH